MKKTVWKPYIANAGDRDDFYNFDQMRLKELTNLFESDSFAEEDEAYLGDVAHAIVRFGDTGVAYLSDILSSGDDVHQRWPFSD